LFVFFSHWLFVIGTVENTVILICCCCCYCTSLSH